MDKFEREIKQDEQIENVFLDGMKANLPLKLQEKLGLVKPEEPLTPRGAIPNIVAISFEELKELEDKGIIKKKEVD